jgi:hypothetical protein
MKMKGATMKKKNIKKTLIPTLLATVYTIPALAGGDDQIKAPHPSQEPAKSTIASEAVAQEVIQLLRQGETDQVTLNIAGRAGIWFRLHYSQTGKPEDYAPVPKGEGVIGEDGIGSISFELKKLGKEEVYLKVTTSDTADFAETRVTPKPIILEVEQVQVKERNLERTIQKIKNKIDQKTETRTPSAVAGVRG